MNIVLASRNRHKIAELETMLRGYLPEVELLSLDEVGITEEIEENGSTFEENALIKAKAAAKSGYIGVGDDSGLTVEALGGAPGIYSARYAGGHGDDEANRQLLLHNLAGIADRRAAFVCAIACVFPDGREPIVVTGRCDGKILYQEEGSGGFGYDSLFCYEEYDRSFAAVTQEQKDAVSHRARAISRFAEEFASRIGNNKE